MDRITALHVFLHMLPGFLLKFNQLEGVTAQAMDSRFATVHQRRSGWDNRAQEDFDAHYDPEPGSGGRGSYRREGSFSRYERERDSHSRISNPLKRRHVEEPERRDSGYSRRHDSWEHDKFDGSGSEYRHRSREAVDYENSSRHGDRDYDSDRDKNKRDSSRRFKDDKGGRSRDRTSERDRWHDTSNSYGSDDHGSRSPYEGGWQEEGFASQDSFTKAVQEYPQQQEQHPVVPSGTVVVKGLSQKTVEDDLYRALEGWGPLKHVRVIKEKTSGASRGFAFIDFPSVEAAERLMQAVGNDGVIVNGRRLFFEYSRPSGGAYPDYRFPGLTTKPPPAIATDWICAICGYLNFARRIVCLQCNEARGEEAADLSGYRGPDPAPSHVLAVRGLEESIDEEILHYEFSKYAPIKDLRLIRDKFTHVSRGYAFIHFHSVEDAAKALESSNGTAIDKNGQILRVAFAKSPYGGGPPAGGRAAAATDAAASVQQYDGAGWEPKEYETQIQPAEEEPQTSGFVWDEASGYYYDAATKFYYDGNRNLYYDGTHGVWYTFNQELQQYEPFVDANPVDDAIKPPGAEAKDEAKPKKVIRASAVISAPAVHNDQSEKKGSPDVKKETEKAKEVRLALKNPGSNKKKMTNAFNLWKQRQNEEAEKAASDEDGGRLRQSNSNKSRVAAERDSEAVSTSFKTDTPSHTPHFPRSKRRFTESAGAQHVYRDRAAERRSLYGLTVPGSEEMEEIAATAAAAAVASGRDMPYPPGVGGRSSSSQIGGPESFEVITSEKALDESNIGNRMLRSMGWQEGSGLGREGTGIVEPRSYGKGGAGQPEEDGRFEAQPGDSYRAIIRKKSFARFHDML